MKLIVEERGDPCAYFVQVILGEGGAAVLQKHNTTGFSSKIRDVVRHLTANQAVQVGLLLAQKDDNANSYRVYRAGSSKPELQWEKSSISLFTSFKVVLSHQELSEEEDPEELERAALELADIPWH